MMIWVCHETPDYGSMTIYCLPLHCSFFLRPCRALVACAAHLENPHRPDDQDIAEFNRVVMTNVRGTFLTLTAFGTGMLQRGHGSIVTIGSITAFNSSPLVAYGPSKFAVLAITRDFAGAWGRKGIRVNACARAQHERLLSRRVTPEVSAIPTSSLHRRH